MRYYELFLVFYWTFRRVDLEFVDLRTSYQKYKLEMDKAVLSVLQDGLYILGPEVFLLEEELKKYVETHYCVSVSSGTDALLIALMALDVGPEDEVITTPYNGIGTAEVIEIVGAKPVFVDIDARTFNIDIEKIEKSITARTKAIIPVNLFGQMPDYERINTIAQQHGLFVIEDGSQSFGAMQRSCKSGFLTQLAITSFFPSRTLGCCGDGGAIFTTDESLYEKMKAIRNHGAVSIDNHAYLGVTGRLDTIQAAILRVKLKHFDEELQLRKQVADVYNEHLKDFCKIPYVEPFNTHVYAQYTICSNRRNEIAQTLQRHEIPYAIYYKKGLYMQPVFAHLNYDAEDFPNTEKITQEAISLPMHPWLQKKDQMKVINAIKQALCSSPSY